MRRRTIHSLILNGSLFAVAMLALRVLSSPRATASSLGLGIGWTNRIFDISLLVALAAFVLIAFRLALSMYRSGRRVSRAERSLASCESGAVMVEWLLVLPIFLMIMGMVIQLALLGNGAMVIRYAAFAAARSAIVSLERPWYSPIGMEEVSLEYPTGLSADDRIKRVSNLVLASISPESDQSLLDAPDVIYDILNAQSNNGWKMGDSKYRSRYKYADAASDVTIEEGFPDIKVPTGLDGWFGSSLSSPSIPVPNIGSPYEVQVTIRYKFLITIPVFNIPAAAFQLGRNLNPLNPQVKGETFDIEQACVLQSTGARAGALGFQAAAFIQDASIIP